MLCPREQISWIPGFLDSSEISDRSAPAATYVARPPTRLVARPMAQTGLFVPRCIRQGRNSRTGTTCSQSIMPGCSKSLSPQRHRGHRGPSDVIRVHLCALCVSVVVSRAPGCSTLATSHASTPAGGPEGSARIIHDSGAPTTYLRTISASSSLGYLTVFMNTPPAASLRFP